MRIKDWKIVKWAKRHKWLTGTVLVLLALYIISHNWIYHGRVVDAETGKPIEGAVVVAKWLREVPTIAGPSNWVGDVKETLTGKDGRWVMRGHRPLLDSVLPYLVFIPYTKQPRFIVYKPGYCPWPEGYGITACDGIYVGVKHYGNVASGDTLGLPKLTKREDRKRALPGPVDTADDSRFKEVMRKQDKFIKLIDEERKYLGLEAYDYEFLREDRDASH